MWYKWSSFISETRCFCVCFYVMMNEIINININGLGKKDKNCKVPLTYCQITTQKSDYQFAFLANYMKYVGKLIKKLSPKNSHFLYKEFKCLLKKVLKHSKAHQPEIVIWWTLFIPTISYRRVHTILQKMGSYAVFSKYSKFYLGLTRWKNVKVKKCQNWKFSTRI